MTTPRATGDDVANVKINKDAKGSLAGKVKTLEDYVHLVITVLQIGLVAIIVSVVFGAGAWYASSMAERQATYQDLRDQVYKLNVKIDTITTALQKAYIIK